MNMTMTNNKKSSSSITTTADFSSSSSSAIISSNSNSKPASNRSIYTEEDVPFDCKEFPSTSKDSSSGNSNTAIARPVKISVIDAINSVEQLTEKIRGDKDSFLTTTTTTSSKDPYRSIYKPEPGAATAIRTTERDDDDDDDDDSEEEEEQEIVVNLNQDKASKTSEAELHSASEDSASEDSSQFSESELTTPVNNNSKRSEKNTNTTTATATATATTTGTKLAYNSHSSKNNSGGFFGSFFHSNNSRPIIMSTGNKTRVAERLTAASNKPTDQNRSGELDNLKDKFDAFTKQFKPFIGSLKNYHAAVVALEYNRSEVRRKGDSSVACNENEQ
jgi:hypothetical protein